MTNQHRFARKVWQTNGQYTFGWTRTVSTLDSAEHNVDGSKLRYIIVRVVVNPTPTPTYMVEFTKYFEGNVRDTPTTWWGMSLQQVAERVSEYGIQCNFADFE